MIATLLATFLFGQITYTPAPDGTYNLKARPSSANTETICFFDEAVEIGCAPSDGIADVSLNTVLDCGAHVITATARNVFGESVQSNSGGTVGVPCAPLLIAP